MGSKVKKRVFCPSSGQAKRFLKGANRKLRTPKSKQCEAHKTPGLKARSHSKPIRSVPGWVSKALSKRGKGVQVPRNSTPSSDGSTEGPRFCRPSESTLTSFRMHLNRSALLLVFLAVCSLAYAADETNAVDSSHDAEEKSTTVPATQTSSDITIPGSLVQMLMNGGAVAAGIVVVATLATLIWPVLQQRMCNVFGTCDNIYAAAPYPATAYQQDYAQSAYGQGGTFNNPTNYQKRSIEYLTPVLKALGNAYEKYNHASVTTAKKLA
ncbi:hypothetical protein GE061_014395 [Apolygus lucorum]|uniref:Uncharacterized protein n=1 Tax=Apolygus lucorum TaxID=248454 RepID=A0A8S9XSS0_APOLU|nr:hypothetical protein GE061_014395 [Apolygus lucorum]